MLSSGLPSEFGGPECMEIGVDRCQGTFRGGRTMQRPLGKPGVSSRSKGSPHFPHVWGDDPIPTQTPPKPDKPVSYPSVTRFRAVWSVKDNRGVLIARFDYKDRATAEERAAALTREIGAEHFVEKDKVPITSANDLPVKTSTDPLVGKPAEVIPHEANSPTVPPATEPETVPSHRALYRRILRWLGLG